MFFWSYVAFGASLCLDMVDRLAFWTLYVVVFSHYVPLPHCLAGLNKSTAKTSFIRIFLSVDAYKNNSLF